MIYWLYIYHWHRLIELHRLRDTSYAENLIREVISSKTVELTRRVGRDVTVPSDKIDAEQFHRYFDEKVTSVRSITAGSLMSSVEQSSADASINCFQTVNPDEVVAAESSSG